MYRRPNTVSQIHNNDESQKINRLEQKINTTKQNIEISEEIIDETPYDAQREKLIRKNENRKHAIGSMEKEIRDLEQSIEEKSREVSI